MSRIAALEALLGEDGGNALLHYALGSEHLRAGDMAAAVRRLQRACELDPAHSASWKLLGKAELTLGNPAGAREAWMRGIATAISRGDRQAEREMHVFLRRLDAGGGATTESQVDTND